MELRSIRFYSLILTFALLVVGCKEDQEKKDRTYTHYEGAVFGAYYRIKIDSKNDFKVKIDSIFNAINTAVNSYVGQSEITTFNSTGILENPSATFLSMLKQAQHFQQVTNGYFEPALYPIFKAWKFEQGGAKMQIDSLELNN